MRIRLWLIRETEKARQYCKFDYVDREVTPDDGDTVWIPRSIVEHTTKRGNEHELELPDWFIERERL